MSIPQETCRGARAGRLCCRFQLGLFNGRCPSLQFLLVVSCDGPWAISCLPGDATIPEDVRSEIFGSTTAACPSQKFRLANQPCLNHTFPDEESAPAGWRRESRPRGEGHPGAAFRSPVCRTRCYRSEAPSVRSRLRPHRLCFARPCSLR